MQLNFFKIEKEVVEEARAQGQISGNVEGCGEDDEDEFGGDHMGRNGEDDEDYVMEEDEELGFNASFSTSQTDGSIRRSSRPRKERQFADFLKNEIDSDMENEEYQPRTHSSKGQQLHQTAELEADISQVCVYFQCRPYVMAPTNVVFHNALNKSIIKTFLRN